MHAGYRVAGTRLSGVFELQASEVSERCALAPLAPLEQLDDGAAARSGVQADIVHAGSHDRHSSARLGELGDIGGSAPAAEQSGRADRRPAQMAPTVDGPEARRVKAAAVVEYLEDHAVPGHLGYHLVPPGPGVPQHVGARLGGSQEQIGDAGFAQAEAAEGIAKDAPHDGNAERLVREHEAKTDRPTIPAVSGQFVLVQQPRSHVPVCLRSSALLQFAECECSAPTTRLSSHCESFHSGGAVIINSGDLWTNSIVRADKQQIASAAPALRKVVIARHSGLAGGRKQMVSACLEPVGP